MWYYIGGDNIPYRDIPFDNNGTGVTGHLIDGEQLSQFEQSGLRYEVQNSRFDGISNVRMHNQFNKESAVFDDLKTFPLNGLVFSNSTERRYLGTVGDILEITIEADYPMIVWYFGERIRTTVDEGPLVVRGECDSETFEKFRTSIPEDIFQIGSPVKLHCVDFPVVEVTQETGVDIWIYNLPTEKSGVAWGQTVNLLTSYSYDRLQIKSPEGLVVAEMVLSEPFFERLIEIRINSKSLTPDIFNKILAEVVQNHRITQISRLQSELHIPSYYRDEIESLDRSISSHSYDMAELYARKKDAMLYLELVQSNCIQHLIDYLVSNKNVIDVECNNENTIVIKTKPLIAPADSSGIRRVLGKFSISLNILNGTISLSGDSINIDGQEWYTPQIPKIDDIQNVTVNQALCRTLIMMLSRNHFHTVVDLVLQHIVNINPSDELLQHWPEVQ